MLAGECDVWVRSGSVSIVGARIQASSKLHRVYAPYSHSLPAICNPKRQEGKQSQTSEIALISCQDSLRKLFICSQLFNDVWPGKGGTDATFIIVNQGKGSAPPPLLSLSPSTPSLEKHTSSCSLECPPQWLQTMELLERRHRQEVIRLLICGSKGSGKSTFMRHLSNFFLTRANLPHGFALLELDPELPEFGLPGQISLVHIDSYLFGPSFTHMQRQNRPGNYTVRSHFLGSSNTRIGSEHFVRCAMDLLHRYMSDFRPLDCPLIVNTHALVHSRDTESVRVLIESLALSDVACLQIGDVDEASEEMKSTSIQARTGFHIVPSRSPQPVSKGVAELQAMQTVSYFYTRGSDTDSINWTPTPLHHSRLLGVPLYGSPSPVQAIIVVEDEINVASILESIDGSLMGLLALKTDFFIRAALEQGKDTHFITPQKLLSGDFSSDMPSPTKQNFQTSTVLDLAGLRSDISGNRRMVKMISGIEACDAIDPRCCRCIAQVLVRGIDPRQRSIQIHVPFEWERMMRNLDNEILVLVKRRLDVPAWAFSEACCLAHCIEPVATQSGRDKATSWGCVSFSSIERSKWLDAREHRIGRKPFAENAISRNTSQRGGRVWKVRKNLKSR